MGTALVLLFLLALGAIPGALLPQRSLNESKVAEYLGAHPTLGPWLDRLQAFDVFSSFWFTAIYVLLFISLVGCVTPRMVEHVRGLRAVPVAAPRNLGRLPKHHTEQVEADPDELAETMTHRLRGWRTVIRRQTDEVGETTEISAEKGYLREFGNIVFHFSLLGLLVAVAAGKLFGYEGNVIVVADGGPGFCTASPAAFDSFRAGNTVDGMAVIWANTGLAIAARKITTRSRGVDQNGIPGASSPDGVTTLVPRAPSCAALPFILATAASVPPSMRARVLAASLPEASSVASSSWRAL